MKKLAHFASKPNLLHRYMTRKVDFHITTSSNTHKPMIRDWCYRETQTQTQVPQERNICLQIGPEERIFSCSSQRERSPPVRVYLQRKDIRVRLPPLWSQHGSSNLHKVVKRCSANLENRWNSGVRIYRRFPSPWFFTRGNSREYREGNEDTHKTWVGDSERQKCDFTNSAIAFLGLL